MKQFQLRFLSLLFVLLMFSSAYAEDDKSRGLFAFVYGTNVQVSWRMRATDDPYQTKYRLYYTTPAGTTKLLDTYTDVTTVQVASSTYGNCTFSLVVLDKDNKEIDRQENVAVKSYPYVDIPLNAPKIMDTVADTAVVSYTPGDCSAYDMDGDGEQEIILKWMPEGGTKCIGSRIYTAHAFFDCYKLDGTRLWRIDAGQNSNAGNNAAFFCWDFDGDGIGEMMLKTAPGTKDGLGHYCGSAAHSNTGEDLPGYADTLTYYRRGSDGLPTYGVWKASGGTLSVVEGAKSYEWCTVFNGVTGEELGSCDYWPYFNIQENWYPGGKDGATYGRRGCSQKGGVMKIPCNDGVVRPTSCFQRGAYTYVYCTDYSWDGKTLKEEWRHSSIAATGVTNCSYCERNGEKTYKNISLYSEGAHPSETADLDGDGYDELMIGAAALDHDGTVLWSTKLGHGDAVAVGDLDPTNPGLECWRITEHSTGYASSMHDGATGKLLCGEKYDGDDVNRGLCIDIDSTHVGTEYVHNASEYFYDCKGNALYKKNFTSNTGYPNYRIFWDGDLLEEHFSDECVSKFVVYGDTVASNYRCSAPNSGTNMLWKLWPVSSINGTKGNPCLQCDLFGDWREELVMFTVASNTATRSADGTTDYALRILTTTFNTDKKLPWLRDDNTYSKEIACQNIGYSQPPHLGYNPFVYYDSLRANAPVLKFEPVEGKDYYMMSDDIHYMDIAAGLTSTNYVVNSTTPSTVQFEYTATEGEFLIKCGENYLADYSTSGFQLVSSAAEATHYTAVAYAKGIVFKSGDKTFNSLTGTTINRNSTKCKYFTIIDASGSTAVEAVTKSEQLSEPAKYYTIDGRALSAPIKGVNIVKYRNGSVKKVFIK